jgi:hypothetical protein
MRISFLSFMKHIVYLSRAVHSLSDQELTHLLRRAAGIMPVMALLGFFFTVMGTLRSFLRRKLT